MKFLVYNPTRYIQCWGQWELTGVNGTAIRSTPEILGV